jgi:hypothetical protein
MEFISRICASRIGSRSKCFALTDVAEVDVLDDYGLLIVLSGASCISLSLTGV